MAKRKRKKIICDVSKTCLNVYVFAAPGSSSRIPARLSEIDKYKNLQFIFTLHFRTKPISPSSLKSFSLVLSPLNLQTLKRTSMKIFKSISMEIKTIPPILNTLALCCYRAAKRSAIKTITVIAINIVRAEASLI